jgi:hypothetical protein
MEGSAMAHHPKVIIAMIECLEPVSDSDVALADAWMRDHPADYPDYMRRGIREIGEIIAKGNAEIAELKDQTADWQARLDRLSRRL